MGFVSSYLRMAWKVANYNALRDEASILRSRYKKLQTEANQTNDQLAKLTILASEVSMAYGIKRVEPAALGTEPSASTPVASKLIPSYHESLQEYDTLRLASMFGVSRNYARRWFTNVIPSLWPVEGRLMSYYGQRSDPLNGGDAFHSGLDISVPMGTQVRASADGIVMSAGFDGGYGRLIVVDHGGGLRTYYAHLSRIDVIPGMEVRRGQVIAASGASGRVTGPHLHYEVRRNGFPLNPRLYMTTSLLSVSGTKSNRDLGL
ncbi:MAG: M23 family metallopeptidase [Bryobacterales bacterium]|nr:M23 family metallopeptidase [Bryobacterales bacterium]